MHVFVMWPYMNNLNSFWEVCACVFQWDSREIFHNNILGRISKHFPHFPFYFEKKKKKQNNSKSQPSQTPNIIGVAFRYLNKIFLIVFFTSTCLIKLLCICKIPDVWKLEIVSTKINLYQDFCNLAFHLHSLVVSYWLWLWYNYA